MKQKAQRKVGKPTSTILSRIVEEQAYRCAVCQSEIEYRTMHTVRVVLDGRQRSSKNSVGLCFRCSGQAGNYPTLMDFYEAFLAGECVSKEKKAISTIYPDNITTLKALVAARGLNVENVNFPNNIERVSPERLSMIAANLQERRGLSYDVSTFAWSPRIAVGKNVKIKKSARLHLFNKQHGRCHYDGYPMMLSRENDPRGATFEHLICRADDGPDTLDNLVLACNVCNGLRNVLQMSADEFKVWAEANPEEIERYASGEKKMSRKLLRQHEHRCG